MENKETHLSPKDVRLALLAGFLIGLLLLPILKTSKPDLYESFFLITIPLFLIATPLGLIIAFQIGKKFSLVWQLGKFGVTGVLNTLVDLGILSLLTYLMGTNLEVDATDRVFAALAFPTFYSFYKSISFVLANLNSYYWNKYWTFKQNETEKKTEFLQFLVVSLVGLFINVTVSSLVFYLAGSEGSLSQARWGLVGAAAGSVVGLGWNFIGYKFIVFKR